MVNSYHHQGIDRLGAGVEPVAWADDGIVEALELEGDAWVLGVQWELQESWKEDARMLGVFADFAAAAGLDEAGFSQTETCLRLSLVNGSRVQPLQRSRSLIPASCAIRSSSAGHDIAERDRDALALPSTISKWCEIKPWRATSYSSKPRASRSRGTARTVSPGGSRAGRGRRPR